MNAWAIEGRTRTPDPFGPLKENPWRLQGIYSMPEPICSVEIRKDLENRPYVFLDRERARGIARILNKDQYAQYRVVRVRVEVERLRPLT